MSLQEPDWSKYLNDTDAAATVLCKLLNAGELALFVGAGISRDLGAPSWHSLARAMAWKLNLGCGSINHKTKRGGDLAEIFDEIKERDSHFDAHIKKWLYFKWNKKSGNWASDLLVALGSLMSGTIRGRVDTVLTLNFDSILEMYLRLYGFRAQSISDFPCILRRADVHIFHSHGYLPLDAEDGDDSGILLSKQNYLETMGEENNFRKRMMNYIIGQKRVLAVGLSGDDDFSRAALAALAKHGPHGSLVGFWVIGPHDSSAKVSALKASKIAAIRLPSFDYLPEFLFNIARKASAATIP